MTKAWRTGSFLRMKSPTVADVGASVMRGGVADEDGGHAFLLKEEHVSVELIEGQLRFPGRQML